MRQPSDVAKFKPSHWAARLAVLVACAGALASSGPFFQMTGEYEGPPLRLLSPEQPKLTRTLVTRFSSEEAFAPTAFVRGRLTVGLAATWKPTDPLDPTTPTLRLRLHTENAPEDPNEVPNDVVLEQDRQQMSVYSDDLSCPLDGACEWRVLFTLEVLPKSARGALEVEWKVVGDAYTDGLDEEPKGLTLQITEQ